MVDNNITEITSFNGDFRWLSNFYPLNKKYLVRLEDDVLPDVYPTVEHAYQAAKFDDPVIRSRFLPTTLTAGQAKRLGGNRLFVNDMRGDWFDVRVEVMTDLLQQKFQDPGLRELLCMTGSAEIIEGNNWHDNFWGDCHCSQCATIDGKNILGDILMTLRSEFCS